MRVMLCRSNAIGSRLIRILTWSEYSHAALMTPEGTVIEATLPRVREVPAEVVIAAHTDWHIVDLPCADEAGAIWWARGQLDKPYDWRAIVGFLVHRDWTSPRAWFCSELVAAAFARGGSPLFRAGAAGRVTPQMLWLLPGRDLSQ
jgi:uncharacterized protein YycO